MSPPEIFNGGNFHEVYLIHADIRSPRGPGLKSSIEKGIAFKVPHTAMWQDGTLGGARVYKPCAFGPPESSQGVDECIFILDTEENRRQVEGRIRELAGMGG